MRLKIQLQARRRPWQLIISFPDELTQSTFISMLVIFLASYCERTESREPGTEPQLAHDAQASLLALCLSTRPIPKRFYNCPQTPPPTGAGVQTHDTRRCPSHSNHSSTTREASILHPPLPLNQCLQPSSPTSLLVFKMSCPRCCLLLWPQVVIKMMIVMQ